MPGIRSRLRSLARTLTSRLSVESLESRLVPYSVSGNAWPRPDLITIGFVPDDTALVSDALGPVSSNLNSTFNTRFGSATTWQKEILRAAATWASQTNINFKVLTDNGASSGSGLYQQGDPNMADIRIGGYDFGDTTLSEAYLPAPINNYSIAGDINFNTGQTWNIGNTYDLYTVALHEFGHALGLNHGASTSVMNSSYNGAVSALTSDDISGIRAVTGYPLNDGYSSPGYGGARTADTFDAAASNASFATASTLTMSSKSILLQNLDLTGTSDTDYYKFTVPSGWGGSLTVRVQSTGLSLLSPTLTLYNSAQSQMSTISATGQYGATVTRTITVTAGQVYYIRVTGAESTALGTGKYALSLVFPGGSTPTVPLPSTLTANGTILNSGGGVPISLDADKLTSVTPDYTSTLYWEQQSPNSVAIDANGNYVTTWMNNGADGSGSGVYAALYNANGTIKKAPFRVNIITEHDQITPAVAMNANGTFIITWASWGLDGSDLGVYAQRYDSNGNPQGGEFLVNQTTAGDQHFPAVSMNDAGDFAITWTSNSTGTNRNVYLRLYNAAGIARTNELLVNQTTVGAQSNSVVGLDRNGNAVVAWASFNQDYADGSGGIYARRFSLTGTSLSSEFRVNTTVAGDQVLPSVAVAPNGSFVLAWQGWTTDLGWEVYGRRYNSAGVSNGTEFVVNQIREGGRYQPVVSIQAGGNFLVTWTGWDNGSGSWDMQGRSFRQNGNPLSSDFRVNTTSAGYQADGAVAMNSNGQAVVVWAGEDSNHVVGLYHKRLLIYTGGAYGNLKAGTAHSFNPDGCPEDTGTSGEEDHDHDHHHDAVVPPAPVLDASSLRNLVTRQLGGIGTTPGTPRRNGTATPETTDRAAKRTSSAAQTPLPASTRRREGVTTPLGTLILPRGS